MGSAVVPGARQDEGALPYRHGNLTAELNRTQLPRDPGAGFSPELTLLGAPQGGDPKLQRRGFRWRTPGEVRPRHRQGATDRTVTCSAWQIRTFQPSCQRGADRMLTLQAGIAPASWFIRGCASVAPTWPLSLTLWRCPAHPGRADHSRHGVKGAGRPRRRDDLSTAAGIGAVTRRQGQGKLQLPALTR